jgi:hypothetical protein
MTKIPKISQLGGKVYFGSVSEVSVHGVLALLLLGLWQGSTSLWGWHCGANLLAHGGWESKSERKEPGPQ